jgi:hypothetical protein
VCVYVYVAGSSELFLIKILGGQGGNGTGERRDGRTRGWVRERGGTEERRRGVRESEEADEREQDNEEGHRNSRKKRKRGGKKEGGKKREEGRTGKGKRGEGEERGEKNRKGGREARRRKRSLAGEVPTANYFHMKQPQTQDVVAHCAILSHMYDSHGATCVASMATFT